MASLLTSGRDAPPRHGSVAHDGRLTISITGDAEALPDIDHLIAAVGQVLDEFAR